MGVLHKIVIWIGKCSQHESANAKPETVTYYKGAAMGPTEIPLIGVPILWTE